MRIFSYLRSGAAFVCSALLAGAVMSGARPVAPASADTGLQLSETSITFTDEFDSGWLFVRNGNDLLSWTSTNTNVATATIDGDEATVIPHGNGTAIVTFTDVFGNSGKVDVRVNMDSADEDDSPSLTDIVYMSSTVRYGENAIKGELIGEGSGWHSPLTAQVKVGKKTIKKKIGSSGKFKLTVPVCKIGYKYKVVVKDTDGHKATKTVKVKKDYLTSVESNYIYKSSSKVRGTVFYIHKGDKVQVRIGKKVYTKKLKKAKKSRKFSVRIKRAHAGTKTKVWVVNKFGQKLAAESADVVYAGNTLRTGMSTKQVKLVAGYRYPDHINYYTYNDQWVYNHAYLYFRFGKLTGWQILG